jgi:protein gp37
MNKTSIQWAHSTVNPLMGCLGCELFPEPKIVLDEIDLALASVLPSWKSGEARTAMRRLIDDAYKAIEIPSEGHSRALSTTNIVHASGILADQLTEEYGAAAGVAVREAIDRRIVCYASKLHLNRATSIVAPGRKTNPGYAPSFERIRAYPGRAMQMARRADLLGKVDPEKPWADGLPRLIFVGDMGDTFARQSDFDFIAEDLMPAIESAEGRRHLWLLLSKRPERMAEYSRLHGRFPANVCCMTTVTSPQTAERLDRLREINCAMRGVSAEPLWERVAPASLNLESIDWFIVGGASGARKNTKPFDLAWARELRNFCHESGVAYFLKQLGTNPVVDGVPFKLADRHGGEWHEWPEDLRVRDFPAAFHAYRRKEGKSNV